MKKLISFIVITIVLLIPVYAEPKPLYETGSSEQVRYVTHAKGETYVVYTKYNEVGDMYFYLATLKNGRLNNIGEIDEMIGGNNEPTTYDVVGMPQYEADHYYVMGMVQMNGEVYLAKKRHIYKLEGNTLVEFDLKFKGKPWSIEELTGTTVIGQLATNGKALYMTMSAVGTYLTADSEDAFATPLDGQVIRIDKDGNLTFTYTYIPQHFMLSERSNANKHVDFAVNENEDRLVYEKRIIGKERLHTVALGETKPDVINAGVEDRYEYNENKVMYIGNALYSYRMITNGRYINDNSVEIIHVTLNKRIPYRDTRTYNAAWTCTTEKVEAISNISYIDSWSLGDDKSIYIVAYGRQGSDGKGTEGYKIYKVKP